MLTLIRFASTNPIIITFFVCLFAKATPTNHTDYSSYTNSVKLVQTIIWGPYHATSCNIMPLVNGSLWGGHIHTHAYRHSRTESVLKTRHTSATGQHVRGLTKILKMVGNGPYSLLVRASYFISCSVYARSTSVIFIVCKWRWGCRYFLTSHISMLVVKRSA